MLVHRFIVRRHFAKHSAKHFRRSFHKHAVPHLSFLRLPQSPRVLHFADHLHASIRALKPVPEHRREASRALASHPLGRRQRPRSRREIPSAVLQRGEFHLIPEQLRGREREKKDFSVDPNELLACRHDAGCFDWKRVYRVDHTLVRRFARRHAQKNQLIAGQRARLVEIARLASTPVLERNADATGERNAERLRAENPLLREIDQRVVHRVGEFQWKFWRNHVGDDHDTMQNQLPVVSFGVQRAGSVHVQRRQNRENQQNEDEDERFAVICGRSRGRIHHVSQHVALGRVKTRSNHIGDASLIHRLAHILQRRFGVVRFLQNDLRSSVHHVTPMKIVFLRDGETLMSRFRGYHGGNADFGLGNRLSGEHGFVDHAGSVEKQAIAGRDDGGAAMNAKKRGNSSFSQSESWIRWLLRLMRSPGTSWRLETRFQAF